MDSFELFLSPHMHYVHDFQKGIIYNQYPPGFPFILSLFMLMGGEELAYMAVPILQTAFLFLFFLYCSRMFGYALASYVILSMAAFYSVFIMTCIPMSDIPSMMLIAGSLVLLACPSPQRVLSAIISGALWGFSLTFRYSNILAFVPVFYVLRKMFKAGEADKTFIISFLTAFSVCGFIPLAAYQLYLFGNPFHSTYPDSEAMKMIYLHNWQEGSRYYLRFLFNYLRPGEIVLVLTGVITGLFSRRWKTLTTVCLLTFLSFFVFHIFPVYRHERYLLPAVPFLIILQIIPILVLLDFWKGKKGVSFMLKGLIIYLGVLAFAEVIYYRGGADWSHRLLAERIELHTEENAVVFCDLQSGPIRYYAARKTYRLGWLKEDKTQKMRVFSKVMNCLLRKKIPAYFLIDNKAKLLPELDLLQEKYIFAEKKIPGIHDPFYKLMSKKNGEAEDGDDAPD